MHGLAATKKMVRFFQSPRYIRHRLLSLHVWRVTCACVMSFGFCGNSHCCCLSAPPSFVIRPLLSPLVYTGVIVGRCAKSGTSLLIPLHCRRMMHLNSASLCRLLVQMHDQEMTFNVDGISLLERGEVPDEALAKELGEMQLSQPIESTAHLFRPAPPRALPMPCVFLAGSRWPRSRVST